MDEQHYAQNEEPETDTSSEGQESEQTDDPGEAEESTAASEDTQPKLIFGKYKSMDEAEKGHKEAETRFHQSTEEAKKLREQNSQYQQQLAYYNQQLAQANAAKQDEYQTDEERLSREVAGLKQSLVAQQNEILYNSFLDKNKDLQGEAEKQLFDGYIYAERIRNPYAPPQELLQRAAATARDNLLKIRGATKTETREVRRQIDAQEQPKGQPKSATPPESGGESPADYIAQRRAAQDRTRRLY